MVNLLSRFQQVRHQMLYLSLLFSVSIILLTVISCSADSSSNLIGKWEMVALEWSSGEIIKKSPPREVIEFFSDKTLDYIGENCNWTILEDGRIKITSSAMGGGRVFYGLLQGDILKIQGNQDGPRYQFKKMMKSQKFQNPLPLDAGGFGCC